MSGNSFGYERDLERNIPGATVVRDREGRWHYTLPCGECGPVEAFTNAARLPIEKIHVKLTDHGWSVGNRANKHRCPDHVTAPRAQHEEPTMTEATNVPTAKVPETPSDKAKRARREAVMLLDDVFDIAHGRYKGDESDATVARTVGLAPDAIVKLREEFYGPLKVPSEVEKLTADLDALRANIGREFEAVRASLSSMEENALNRVAALEARVASVAGKFL